MNELIVSTQSKNSLLSSLIVLISVIAACVALILVVSNSNILGIIKHLLQGLLGLIISLFSIATFYILWCWNDTIPLARFTQDGVQLKYHGFVAWKDIERVSLYIVYSTPVECVAIEAKDYNMLFGQSTVSGKCALFWSRIFGYPHIILYNREGIKNQEIIDFANRYLRR